MTKQKIDRFSGEYDFLSNFYETDVYLDGELYPSVEHAFQAAKTTNPKEREKVRLAKTPGWAKRIGRSVKLIENWEGIKESIMEELLRSKFDNNELIREKLLATGEVFLEEGNTWRDREWGVYNGQGKNKLGFLLMKVRDSYNRMY